MSGNAIYRLCFRNFALSCCTWSMLVRWRPLMSAAIVTQLVTRLWARGARCWLVHAWSTAALLLGLGQYRVDAGLIFRQAGTPGGVGLRLAPGLRLASGVFPVAGHGSLVVGVGVPHCLPDSPDEVLKLTSRDVEPDPPGWVDPHLALVPGETHPMAELPEPGVLARAILPQARPTAADGDLQFDESLAGLVDGADPGDHAGIVAEGIWRVHHAVHSA